MNKYKYYKSSLDNIYRVNVKTKEIHFWYIDEFTSTSSPWKDEHFLNGNFTELNGIDLILHGIEE